MGKIKDILSKLIPVKKNNNSINNGSGIGINYTGDWGSSSAYSQSFYLDKIYNKIATDIATKLEIRHITLSSDNFEKHNDYIYELNLKPNDYQSSYDYWYLLTYQLMKWAFSIAFVDENNQFHVLDISKIDMYIEDNTLHYTDTIDGTTNSIDIDNLMIYRLSPNTFKLRKGGLSSALQPYINLINTNLQELEKMLQGNGKIAAFVKLDTNFQNTAGAQAEAKWLRAQFNNVMGGISFLQKGQEFVELSKDYNLIDKEQVGWIENQLYKAFNLNEDLFSSNYSPEQYAAYYSSILKPIATIYQQQLNILLLTKKDYLDGRRLIIFLPHRDVTNIKDFTEYIDKAIWAGILSPNEVRVAEGLEPINGLDQHYMNLNVAKVEDKSQETKVE